MNSPTKAYVVKAGITPVGYYFDEQEANKRRREHEMSSLTSKPFFVSQILIFGELPNKEDADR